MENQQKVDIAINTDCEIKMSVLNIEKELNKNIGHYWWKSYINSAFWNNFSTPLNLTITILTALTTAETQTKELMTSDTMYKLSLATLLISTLNTFFRPSQQLASANENMGKWRELGNEFEKIELDDCVLDEKLERLKNLMEKVLELRRQHKTSFLTDLIHLCSRALCIKSKADWKPDLNK